MTHEEILQHLYDDTLVGKAPEVRENVERGLEDGLEPERRWARASSAATTSCRRC